MRYRINKTNYRDFSVFQENTLPARSYFIPYPDREQADRVSGREKRYASPKVICLNGNWDFKFYPVPSELPDILDTEQTVFDTIDVPSCWQFRGYAKPFYVNARYQFPYKPPEIPAEEKVGKVFTWCGADYGIGPRLKDPGEEYNFVGVYRRSFDVEDTDKRYVISFLGVSSCLDVYLNGYYVGYSEGSHNTAEFDLTEYISSGANELVVVVHRWCNGSYLECQDMFRNTGIFRDVLLRICDWNDIFDVSFDTAKNEQTSREAFDGNGHTGREAFDGSDKASYRAEVAVKLYADGNVKVTLAGHGIEISKSVRADNKTARVVFDGLDVKEWTAESPYLYDLYVEVPGSTVKFRVGFKDIKVSGTDFTLNGKKLKLHGVNHHDTSSRNGYYLTPEEIERDVKLCKEYNIDTIRTSHYPPDPYLLEMCDEVGIYVVDEADLETHGTFSHMLPPSYNRISNDPKWGPHFVDRAEHLYQRDKMHTSIIMWSLGNESGGTFCTDMMYDYIKEKSPLPVHYESAIHTKRKAYDVASEMYPPTAQVHEIGEKTYKVRELTDRPYFLCEYSHAMGVGPGGMEDYWKEIYTHDNLIGGCVWEMVDHAVLHDDGSYTYGGDHGEWEHDGNFCVDGLFYPDRTPSTGAKIARFTYRPLRVKYLGSNDFEVFNTKAFTGGNRYKFRLVWTQGSRSGGGRVLSAGNSEIIPDVSPLNKNVIHIDTSYRIDQAKESGCDLFLTFVTIDRETKEEVSREQVTLYEAGYKAPEKAESNVYVPDPGHFSPALTFSGSRPVVRFGNSQAAAGDPYTILFRAPTDNDFYVLDVKNSMKPFLDEHEKVESCIRDDKTVTVVTKIKCKNAAYSCIDVYEQTEQGILVTSMLHCINGTGELPRFGKTFRLDKTFRKVEYFGRNGESYADMKDQAQIEYVSCDIDDMTEPNIRPQESGNRCDTRWASVSNGTDKLVFTAVGKPFELGIKSYSDTELLGMKHREDEKETATYVTISAFQKGIGTGICGPKTAPEYCYPDDRDYLLRFLISC